MENNLKILIAEDEILGLMVLARTIKDMGHNLVGEAKNGEELYFLAKEKKPDLIITDINMPIADGLKTIEKLQSELDIPSILISAYEEDDYIEKAASLGVLSYLKKPIDYSNLNIAIKLAISNFKILKDSKKELEITKTQLENRKIIEKAKGIIMDKYRISEAEAMKQLQTISKNKNKKIVDVARKIIEAEEIFK